MTNEIVSEIEAIITDFLDRDMQFIPDMLRQLVFEFDELAQSARRDEALTLVTDIKLALAGENLTNAYVYMQMLLHTCTLTEVEGYEFNMVEHKTLMRELAEHGDVEVDEDNESEVISWHMKERRILNKIMDSDIADFEKRFNITLSLTR